MGSYFSSIDQCVECQIYYPPQTLPEKFQLLTDEDRLSSQVMHHGTSLHIVQPKYPITSKCFIFSHGNGDDIYQGRSLTFFLAEKLGITVINYDYPGYGLSQGNPTEQGCYRALENAIDYTQKALHFRLSQILLVGQSLGTGVVIHHVAQHPNWSAPIILISPYKTIARVVYDSCLVNPIDKYTSIEKVENIVVPTLIFHGEQDRLIHIHHAKELFAQMGNQSVPPVWIPEADHFNIVKMILENYLHRIVEMIYLSPSH